MTILAVMTTGGALAHGAGSTITGGVFVVTSAPSATVKAEGLFVYRGPLTYTFKGGSAPGCDAGTVATTAPQTITPTASKVKVDGALVVRIGDTGTMVATGTSSGSPVPVSGPVRVNDAGQTKVGAQ